MEIVDASNRRAGTSLRGCLLASLLAAASSSGAADPGAATDASTPAVAVGAAADPQPRAQRDPHAREGVASYYSKRLAGRKTSSGERYDPERLTAAHPSLPMGTRLKVVNPRNDRSVVVTVNDRGPVTGGRMLDVSHAAAKELGMTRSGVARVETEVVGHDPSVAK